MFKINFKNLKMKSKTVILIENVLNAGLKRVWEKGCGITVKSAVNFAKN